MPKVESEALWTGIGQVDEDCNIWRLPGPLFCRLLPCRPHWKSAPPQPPKGIFLPLQTQARARDDVFGAGHEVDNPRNDIASQGHPRVDQTTSPSGNALHDMCQPCWPKIDKSRLVRGRWCEEDVLLPRVI